MFNKSTIFISVLIMIAVVCITGVIFAYEDFSSIDEETMYLITDAFLIPFTIVALLVYSVFRQLQKNKVKTKELEIERLQHEHELEVMKYQSDINYKRQLMIEDVKKRIVLTEQLQKATTQVESLPKPLIDAIQSLALIDEENWMEFRSSFYNLYGETFSKVIEPYSKQLSEQDIQYLTLALLGFSNANICCILELTERTIWNRRQKLKSHISNENFDLDEWINNHQLMDIIRKEQMEELSAVRCAHYAVDDAPVAPITHNPSPITYHP